MIGPDGVAECLSSSQDACEYFCHSSRCIIIETFPARVECHENVVLACQSDGDCARGESCVDGACTAVLDDETDVLEEAFPEIAAKFKDSFWVEVVVYFKNNKLTDPFTQKDATIRKNEIARLQSLVVNGLSSEDEFQVTKRPMFSNDVTGRISAKGLLKVAAMDEVDRVELYTENIIQTLR